MPLRHSETDLALANLITAFDGDEGLHMFRERLAAEPTSDGVAALVACDADREETDLSIAKWVRGGGIEPSLRGQSTNSRTEVALLHTWEEEFGRRLGQLLVAMHQANDLAPSGGVLCFVGNVRYCLVVTYRFSSAQAVDLKPLAVVRNPTAVFDLAALMNEATPAQRNALKSLAFSTDKLVYHRGCLVHVERRREPDVFGPSIDTVLMAEVLHDHLASVGRTVQTALEVGSGSGLLSAAILRNASALGSLMVFDLAPSSIACTSKNLENAGAFRRACTSELHLVCGRFFVGLVDRQFDLVVCNPPYVPESSGDRAHHASSDYRHAVAGLELYHEILPNLDRLLSQSGRLLMMFSSVSRDLVIDLVDRERFSIVPVLGEQGIAVPFDLEAAWADKEWLNDLEARGLVERQENDYFHRLMPMWIERVR